MKRHRELQVSSATMDAKVLARHIESFASASPAWELPEVQSAKYEEMCGQPSCCVVTSEALTPRSAVHMTLKNSRTLSLTNIVPLDSSQLTIAEYNQIVQAFAQLVRTCARTENLRVRVLLSKGTLSLAELLPGTICSELFSRFLSGYPLSYHRADIDRLDQFTCGLSRLARKHFDLDSFQQLLMEELNWSENDAKWCRGRVETGLEVLATNKRFYL